MEDLHFIPYENNRKPSSPVLHASKTFVATTFLASLWALMAYKEHRNWNSQGIQWMAITMPLLINRMGYISSVAIKWSPHTGLPGQSCWELLLSNSDHSAVCHEVLFACFSFFNVLHITEHDSCSQLLQPTMWANVHEYKLASCLHEPITVSNIDQHLP